MALSIDRVERAGLSGAAAAELLQAILSDPGLIWDFVIDRHLAWAEHRVLYILASGPVSWPVSDLRVAFDALAAESNHVPTMLEFADALAALDGSLVRTTKGEQGFDVALIIRLCGTT